MFVVFGSRSKVTWTGNEPANALCGSCQQRALVPYVVQRYAHIFWIPVFPLPKKVAFVCGHCQLHLESKEAGPAVASAAVAVKQAVRTPFWMFIGAALFAALVGFGAYESSVHDKERDAWITAPVAGDHYVLNASKIDDTLKQETSYKWVVARVKGVRGEEVDLLISNYVYELASGAKSAIRKQEMSRTDFFDENAVVTVPKSMLATWEIDGTLDDVVRD